MVESGAGSTWTDILKGLSSINKVDNDKKMSVSNRLPTIVDSEYAYKGDDQASDVAQAGDDITSALSKTWTAFGQGFNLGYQSTKVLTAPFLAYRASKQEKAILGMKAELADLNAKSYQTAAEDVLRAGQQKVASITYRAGQARAQTRVSQAGAGIRISGSGSAAEVLTSQAIVTEMQVNQTLANSVIQSFGYQRKKVDAQMNALAVRSAQKQVSPWASAITSFISTSVKAAPSMTESFNGLFEG